ncbi:PEP-CTERM sorting domain-containing protein [Roseofilum sp. BLCC_M91]|uniref:PEP-CTERM sorting domain-containing protein n=1 Tax=Roseofilum halophilum BLCC-M91 TaxID=3022259 RepID=A0ABT7BJP5_9CYAN|nr:PEP-CTERM sorting domain-containing protein [Roseofilum halophilum]MDJ1179402.1 PEP-CTERM sorting domain-containing protein [Roseofilum halophilum BLCC-M91]
MNNYNTFRSDVVNLNPSFLSTCGSSACNPEKVPEPSAVLALFAVGAIGSLLKRR